MAWANDTAAHYAAIRCPPTSANNWNHNEVTIPTIAVISHTKPSSHYYSFLISPRVGGWVDLSIRSKLATCSKLLTNEPHRESYEFNAHHLQECTERTAFRIR